MSTSPHHNEIRRLNAIIRAYENVTRVSRLELEDLHNHIQALESDRDELILLIRAILDQSSPASEERLILQCEQMKEHIGKRVYVDLFRLLLNRQFEADEAESYWYKVLDHKEEMQQKLGRAVGLRVAMHDFFTSIGNVLSNPSIIEINVVDEIMRNTMLDELTGLYNRRFYTRVLENEIKRAKRHAMPLTLLLLDIDNFKNINDDFGHDTGDQVMQRIGTLLKDSLRTEDYPCRIGGEEFAVILPHTDTEHARIVAERFRHSIEGAVMPGRSVTISGGIATYPSDATDPVAIYRKADKALYLAKESGKNRIELAVNLAAPVHPQK